MDVGCGGADKDDNWECIFAPLSTTCSIANTNDDNSMYYPRFAEFNKTVITDLPVRTSCASFSLICSIFGCQLMHACIETRLICKLRCGSVDQYEIMYI